MPSSEDYFLIDDILPANEVHLIGGPSGAGKTRLLFQWLIDWQSKQVVLEHGCAPFPETMYLACDRSPASIKRTMKSFKEMDWDRLKWASIRGKKEAWKSLHLNYPSIKFFIIDGIASMTPNGLINDYCTVQEYLCALGDYCTEYGITILGVVHSSKTKQNEKYLNPRQRIAGSVAWAAFSETVFNLEPCNPDNANDKRRDLYVCPRNSAEYAVKLEMNGEGRLIECFDIELDECSDPESVVYEAIKQGLSARRDIVRAVAKHGVSRASCDNALASLLSKKSIMSPKYGKYTIAFLVN